MHASSNDLFDTQIRTYQIDTTEQSRFFLAHGFTVVDLNDDGHLDVVRSGGNFNFQTAAEGFTVTLGLEGREFSEPVFYPTPTGATSGVVAEDFDGDGDLDLAFSQTNGPNGQWILLFRGNGDGTFGTEQKKFIGDVVVDDLEATDVDNDGDMDLVVGRWVTNWELVILKNNGNASFTTADTVDQNFENIDQIATGDMDGDGFVDVCVSYGPRIALMFNDGNGTFGNPVVYIGASSQVADVQLADVDEDGDLDVVYGEGNPEGRFSIFRNNGDGTLANAYTVLGVGNFDHYALKVADMNNDGHLDIVSSGARLGWPAWVMVLGNGDGTFGTGTILAAQESPWHMAIADVDNDGFKDVVTGGDFTRSVRVNYNSAAGFSAPETFEAQDQTRRAAIADIDLDGDIDIVTAFSTEIWSHLNNGDGTFTQITEHPSESCFEAIELADLNSDQYPDLLLLKDTNCPPYHFYTRINNGDGTFSQATVWEINSAGDNEMAVLDWDNDGDNDVVISERLGCPTCPTYRLFFLEGNGDGTFQLYEDIDYGNTFPGFTLKAGDVNSDGFMDIVGNSDVTHLGNGDGTFQNPTVSSSPHGADEFRLADMNGDGNLDSVFIGYSPYVDQVPTVGIKLGNGDGTFTDMPIQFGPQDEFITTTGVDVIDANSDGNLDIIVSSWKGCDLCVFLGNGDGTIEPMLRFGVNGISHDPQVADFNGDGVDDVASPTYGSLPIADGRVTVLFGKASAVLLGDINLDGVVNLLDVGPFVELLGTGEYQAEADINEDGEVNLLDVAGFVDLLAGG